jgi:hypothetical protein
MVVLYDGAKNTVCPLCLSMMEETDKVPETLDLMQLATQGYSSFLVAMEA